MANPNPDSWIKNLAPAGSWRRRVLAPAWKELKVLRQEGIGAFTHSFIDSLRKWLRGLRKARGIFKLQYELEGYCSVTLYTDQTHLFPEYQPQKRLPRVGTYLRPVSIIATTYNEKASVAAWIESILTQTRPPDEVVIVDGGSKDGTLELLIEYSKKSSIPVKVISEPGANIARGRNIAVERAGYEVIAATDFGCRPHSDWLEKICLPFEDDPQIEVVGGWFHSLENGKPSPRLGWAVLERVDPQTLLPSSRSIAFTKQSWSKVGGYPEWLTLTGEDTYYAMELQRCCPRWAFVPDAVVDWPSPSTAIEYWRKIYNWSIGDGETGAVTQWYWWRFVRLGSVALGSLLIIVLALMGWISGLVNLVPALLIALIAFLLLFGFVYRGMFKLVQKSSNLMWELGAEFAMLAGFLKGAGRRKEVTARRFRASAGLFFILAVVPIDDTGGGARSAQVALELLRQGFVVIYINKFPKYESRELNLEIRHPNLLTSNLSFYNYLEFEHQYARNFDHKPIGALAELPDKEFLPLILQIKALGGTIFYDLLDDWKTSLGGNWYSEGIEAEIIRESDILVATAPNLAVRLKEASGRKPLLLPNAVNSYLFNPERCFPRPEDFPLGTWYMIYIGALWGDWFDWELLVQLANHYPEAGVIVIGDYQGQCLDGPSNLHFLGLKPQTALPAYLSHSNLAIVPWIVSPVTQATSPLKVYEYIAMEKNVIAPDIEPLAEIPGVYRAMDRQDFIYQADVMRQVEFPKLHARRFIQENNWTMRVKSLIDLVKDPQAYAQDIK
jgi:glycosyltransferase involved in cell wall biosynthesis